MTKQARSYTEEFKREAVQLALKSETISSVAESLGVPDSTLHTWVQRERLGGKSLISQSVSSHKKDKADVSQVLEDNRRLQKKVLRLQEETAILKKAAAYFVKDHE